MIASKTTATIALVLIGLTTSPMTSAQTYSTADLLRFGNQYYGQGKCVKAAMFLFAYQRENPPALQQPKHREAVNTAIEWCERNTALAAGGKSDSGAPATKPPAISDLTVIVPPPAVGVTLANARCDVYAKTAISQYQLYRRHGCGPADSRWDPNVSAHYDWCINVSDNQARVETRARQDVLENCAAAK